jgi:hypothetical protein
MNQIKVFMAMTAILGTLIIVSMAYTYVLFSNKVTDDVALTDKQVLDKAQVCHKRDMAIRLVYDEEWNVYAVKCIYGGFTGDGRKK